MADKPIRVLWRVVVGQPSRFASQQERDAASAAFRALVHKWKVDGVKLLGSWMSPGGELDGYCHYLIFEMRDLEQLSQINQEFNRSERGRLTERYSFSVGDINQPWDRIWGEA